jgi:hypothetical protein
MLLITCYDYGSKKTKDNKEEDKEGSKKENCKEATIVFSRVSGSRNKTPHFRVLGFCVIIGSYVWTRKNI